MPGSKIQLRLLVPMVVFLAGTITLVFSALYNYQTAEQRLINERTASTEQALGRLKREIEYRAAQSAPLSHTQDLLSAASIDQSLETLVLFNASGQILANRAVPSSAPTAGKPPSFTEITQLLAAPAQHRISLASDGQSLQAYIALSGHSPTAQRPGDKPALLFASYDLSADKAALWQQISRDFQMTWLITILIVLALAFVLQRFITRPLVKLVEFSQDLANNYSGQQNPGRYLGEIGALNHALNAMSSKVARTVTDLNTQQENLEVTLHSIGDAVITTDTQGRVTRMNPVAEQLTGWYAYEARGQMLTSIFPIVDATTRETIANPIDRVLSTDDTVYLDSHTTLLARDGSEYQIADSAAPIRNADEQIIGVILVFNDVTEEYQLRQAARNIQRQIEGLFNDMRTMAGILEPDGSVIFVNNTPLKLNGISLDDVLGKKIWDCPWFSQSPAAQHAVQACCMRAAAGEQVTQDIETDISRKELLWAEFSVHPVVDEQGAVIQLLAEGHDISPRKTAEAELKASMQRIELYRQQTPLATIEWNTDLQIESWNAAASKLFGYTQQQAIGTDAHIIVPDSAMAEMSSLWDNIIQRHGSEVSISQNITQQGHSILCEWHNSAIIDPAGQVVGMASQVLDITAEHEAKLALIKKEQEQREILSTLAEGIITIDENGNVLTINPAAEKIFGYTSKDICNKDLSTIMPNFDIDQIDQYLRHRVKAGALPILDGLRETIGRRKNHTTFPLQISAAELPPAAAGTRRFIGSFKDLTETKLQHEHLQRTQKMDALGKIVGGVAHDYNNMLGAILGYADLMTAKYGNIEGLNKYIEQITRAGERGRDLTTRLLVFSRQESSQPKAINLHATLASQSELLSKSITALIKLDYQLCDSPWLIFIDRDELEETLLNLAINAKHAMPNGGALTLSTHKRHLDFAQARSIGLAEGDYMQLSVEDSGTGVSKEIADKIFDPFFTTNTDGTGLGLSQAYAFMDLSGGTIRLETTADSGAKFSLYFPRHEGDLAQQTPPRDKPAPPQANAEKILIVDDEPALRDVTQEILTMAGYQVLIADDGEEALTILDNEAVDVLISDIIMPKMNGYSLAKIVSEKYPNIKIQLASGYSGEQALQQDQPLLHSRILRKPFRSAELLNTIATLLESKGNAR
ncbi:MAG: PAS domain S-box protein [Gammaproteobacteria bacterium]|nr:PAS domain S-box protein [Gammaproteobacteria bacterium]MBQ0841086.1 PAS domain S-box protein [Gammaproteobacteria bacterium]